MSGSLSSSTLPRIFERLDVGERVAFVDGDARCSIERTGRSFLVRDADGQPLGVYGSFAEAWIARPRSTLPVSEVAA